MYLWMELILFNLGGEVALHITLELNHLQLFMEWWFLLLLPTLALSLVLLVKRVDLPTYIYISLKLLLYGFFLPFFPPWSDIYIQLASSLKHVCTRARVCSWKETSIWGLVMNLKYHFGGYPNWVYYIWYSCYGMYVGWCWTELKLKDIKEIIHGEKNPSCRKEQKKKRKGEYITLIEN